MGTDVRGQDGQALRLLEGDLRVPSQFGEGGYVNVKGIFLPSCGEDGVVTEMDFQTDKEALGFPDWDT